MANRVEYDIIARDRASSEFRKAGAAADSFGGRMKHLSSVVGAAALGTAMVKFGRDSVAAFADAEKSQNQLADAYRRFPSLAGANVEAMRALNSEIERRTGFDDDALASGEAVLAQFKLTGRQLQELAPLTADYAARIGEDVPTAARNLGRALLGNARALKSVGIDFTDLGSKTANYRQMVDGLRETVGGFAENEAQTAAGQARRLATEYESLQEDVGEILVPALMKLGDVLHDDVIPPVKATVGFIKDNSEVMEPLAKGILLTVAAWKAYTIATRVAQTTTVRFGRTAAATSAQVAASNLGPMFARPGAVGVAGAGSRITPGMRNLALGGGLVTAGMFADQFGGGRVGTAMSHIANTAALGSMFGPGGALVGGIGAALSEALIPILPKKDEIPKAFSRSQLTDLSGTDAGRQALEMRKTTLKTTDAYQLLQKGFHGGKVDEVKRQIDSINKAMREHEDALEADAVAAARAAISYKGFNAEINAQITAVSGAIEANDNFWTSLHNLSGVEKENGRALRGHSQAAINNRAALMAGAKAIQARHDAMIANGKTERDAQRATLGMMQALRRHAREVYGNRDAVDAFLKRLGVLPSEIKQELAGMRAIGQGIGGDLGHGFVMGIQSMQGAATAEAKILAAQTVKQLRLTLDSNSPSKETMSVGEDAGKGYVLGLRSQQVEVIKGAKTLTKATLHELAAVNNALSDVLQFRSGVRSGLADYGSLSGVSGSGASAGTYLHAKANDLRQFVHVLRQLDAHGLSPALIGQISELGPEGIGVAREFLGMGRRRLRRANRDERHIERYAGAGARVAAGTQLGDLEQALQPLPKQFAKELGAVLSKHLNINVQVADDGRRVHAMRRTR